MSGLILPGDPRYAQRMAELGRRAYQRALRHRRIAGPIRVRNAEGKVLLCCFKDCERSGDDRYQVRQPSIKPDYPGQLTIFIFCTREHAEAYVRDAQRHTR